MSTTTKKKKEMNQTSVDDDVFGDGGKERILMDQ